MDNTNEKMIDMRNTEEVEITLGHEGQLWVNVDGKCRLRIYNAGKIKIDNMRDGFQYEKKV